MTTSSYTLGEKSKKSACDCGPIVKRRKTSQVAPIHDHLLALAIQE
uniref:Uncharacterized protein n=1 Tax=Arundo donax TaxID=35708 RepID=A0A0A9HA64_ARUDO